MADSIESLQSKGFGSHGGKQYTVDHDITPLKKRVLVCKMHFGETKSKGGIILIDDDGSEGGIHPRWAEVYAIGNKQEDVKVGQWILVSHGRWSRALKVKKDNVELEVRMIDEDDILLVSDEEPEDNRKQAGYVNTGGMQQMTSMPGND
jgi:co-chaperonin GroES (HSP10)